MRRAVATLAKRQSLLSSSSSKSVSSASSAWKSLLDSPSLPVAARGISQASTSASSSSSVAAAASQVRILNKKLLKKRAFRSSRKLDHLKKKARSPKKRRRLLFLVLTPSTPPKKKIIEKKKTLKPAAPRPYYAVAVLERLPIVAPLPPAWEVEYVEWIRSSKSRSRGKDLHAELGGEGGGASRQKSKKGSEHADGGEEEGEGDTGKWRPAPRVTEADEKGDQSSLRRCLDKRLFLVLGGGGVGEGGGGAVAAVTSLLPSAELRDGETTRATAERALAEAVPTLSSSSSSSSDAAADEDESLSSSSPSSSSVAEAYFVGNAPAGHLTLSGNEGGGGKGGTLFFHRAQLVVCGGSDLLSASSAEALFPSSSLRGDGGDKQRQHAWLTREELAERLGGGEIGELVKAML